MTKKLVIAVDGYSSCGKSTFAKAIARKMNYTYIDSGAMYRAVTLYCLRMGFVKDGKLKTHEIIAGLDKVDIEFVYNPCSSEYETHLNSENVEREIRGLEVSSHVSAISMIPAVRERMVELQRKAGLSGGIVMDGRDIGTVVFPDADIKIFMTASVDIRAKRRFDELVSKNMDADFEEIKRNIIARDIADENRDISPLRRAFDAIELDNSRMTVDQQMDWFMEILETKIHDS